MSLALAPVPFAEQALFVVEKLLRPGEDGAGAWPIGMCPLAKSALGPGVVASWVDFIQDRYASWRKVLGTGRVDEHPVGWTQAAVRLYGGEANVAMSGVAFPPWPGRELAERFLRTENDGLCRLRQPWERG